MKLRPNGLPDRIGARGRPEVREHDFGPGVHSLSDAEHEADSPIIGDDAALVVHEHRQIGLWSSRQDFRDLVVAMQDGLHEPMVRRSRHGDGNAPVKNFRQPIVGLDIGRTGHDSGDQAGRLQ